MSKDTQATTARLGDISFKEGVFITDNIWHYVHQLRADRDTEALARMFKENGTPIE